MEALTKLSAAKMREGLLSGDFSAVELTEAHLNQIESSGAELNDFTSICNEEASEAAKIADKRLKEEKENSPTLTGLPVAVKDMLLTKGIRTTCSSKMLENFIPPYSATVVEKIEQNGGVVIGKTNHDEFGMGASSEHSIFGPVKNPWDHQRVPGGSSGGSAVAVAAGHAPLALSTDTGGSIRQPASFTGVVGLKPTYGRVSRYGVIAFASSLDQVGPHARTVDDTAILLEAISGRDERDSTSIDLEVPNYFSNLQSAKKESLKGLRVGLPKEYFVDGLEADVEAKIREAAKVLEEEGAELVDISLPHTSAALPVYYIIAPAEASSNLARYDGVRYGHRAENLKSLGELYERSRSEGFGDEVQRRILIGSYVLSAGYCDAFYNKALQVRTLIIDDFKSAFQNSCDVILAPVCPSTAFKIGELSNSPLKMYLQDVLTTPASLAGLPGISVPYSLDSKGLPIGVQLLAPHFGEEILLKVAERIERRASFDNTKFCIE